MKKIIFALIFAFSVVGVAHASVTDVCTNLAGDQTMAPVGYNHLDNDTCFQIEGNGNPLLVMQAWGQTGAETLTVQPGTVITDDAGSSYTCSYKIDVQGCSVLVHLDFYKNQMKEMYKNLVKFGLVSQFPQFSYWGR